MQNNNISKPTVSSSHVDVKIDKDQPVAILIDGNNIEISIHDMTGNKNAMPDYDNIVPRLLDGRSLNRLTYFREGATISVKLKERLQKNFHGNVIPCHKSADIPLTIYATQIANKVSAIIILSGDADYIELVRHLKSMGVRVEIAAVKANTSNLLIEEADYYHEIKRTDCFSVKPQKR